MLGEYYRLTPAEGSDGRDALETHHSEADIDKGMVVRNETKEKNHQKSYEMFETPGDFWKHLEGLTPSERCYHEIIYLRQAQRLKFDIDMTDEKINELDEADMVAAHVFSHPGMDMQSKAHAIVEWYLVAIEKLINGAYGLTAAAIIFVRGEHLIVTDSSGICDGHMKYSYHIVTTFFLPRGEYVQYLACKINEYIRVLELTTDPRHSVGILDGQVYKERQGFRITNCTKPGQNRFKTVVPHFGTADVDKEDTLITHCRCNAVIGDEPVGMVEHHRKLLSTLPVDPNIVRRTPNAAEWGLINECLAKQNLNLVFRFRSIKGRFVQFNRLRSSFCDICRRTHDKDHTMYLRLDWVVMQNATELKRVTMLCYKTGRKRPDGQTAGIVLFCNEKLQSTTSTKFTPEDKLHRLIETINEVNETESNKWYHYATKFETLLPEGQKTIYSEEHMRDYELVPTLAVLGQMKLGKSRAMRRMLNGHFVDTATKKHIIHAVSFRKTFTWEISKPGEHSICAEFDAYDKLKGTIVYADHPRLITQVESLGRIHLDPTNPLSMDPETCIDPERVRPPDLLMLDEIESILEQFESPLHKNRGAAWDMFVWMLSTARHVVVMDANLSDRTFDLLTRFRKRANPNYAPGQPKSVPDLIHFHWNSFRRTGIDQDHFEFTTNEYLWVTELLHQMAKGHNLVVAVNSLAQYKHLATIIETERERLLRGADADMESRLGPANTAMKLYSSESTAKEKADFRDVGKVWGDYKILMYTPTLTAGVSYEEKHFDALFGYFTSASCSVETCRQMICRVRDLESKTFYIWLDSRTQPSLPSSTGAIREAILFNRKTLLPGGVDIDRPEIGQGGFSDRNARIAFYTSSFFELFVASQQIRNLSRSDFIHRFVKQVADTGASVNHFVEGDTTMINDFPPEDWVLEKKRISTLVIDVKDKQREADLEATADAPLRTADEIDQLETSSQFDGSEISSEDRFAITKFRLLEKFGLSNVEISTKWVKTYSKLEVYKWYRSLGDILAQPTIDQSLASMRSRQSRDYTTVVGTDPDRSPCDFQTATTAWQQREHIEIEDIMAQSKFYKFANHHLVHRVIQDLGFCSILDARPIPIAEIEENISKINHKSLQTWLHQTKPDLCQDFRSHDSATFIRAANKLVQAEYGIRVKIDNKNADELFGDTTPRCVIDFGKVFELFRFTPQKPLPNVVDGNLRPQIVVRWSNEASKQEIIDTGCFAGSKPRAIYGADM
jgi:hypothetical protein